jgi:tRNA G10  N-methylase Trm11
LEYGVGAWNENVLSSYCNDIYNKISLVTRKGAIILDPFAGSGTMCLAAKKLNRHYIGVEIDSAYVEAARKRILDDSIQLKFDAAEG